MENNQSNSNAAKRSRHVICGVASLMVMSFLTLAQIGGVFLTNGTEVHQQVNHKNLTRHYDIVETVPVTIVCGLSGEMCNNLGKIGKCLSLKWWLESGDFYNSSQKLGYSARVALRHQEANKWVRGRNDLNRCFPNTRQYDFSEANNPEFEEIWKMQHELYGGDAVVGANPPFHDINSYVQQQIKAGLQTFVATASQHHALIYNNASKRNVSMPFLYSREFLGIDPLADRFYEENKEFFRFDESCCKIKADPDENVFHFRNFKKEMPKRWNSYGFHEANPVQVAHILFGHLKEGDKVAIVTRFEGETAQPYVDALEARGLKVRVVDGQDGPADFCFLLSAQKDVVGMMKSTYLRWAGYLGNATRVVAYTLASSNYTPTKYNYTSPGLKGKFEFPVIH
jgi:hypothetical protein